MVFGEVAICRLAVIGIWIFRYFNNEMAETLQAHSILVPIF